MILAPLGHSSIVVSTAMNRRVLIDPYGQPYNRRPAPSFGTPAAARWFLKECPSTHCDLVLVTHPHFDHDAVGRAEGYASIVRDPIRVKTGDISITGHLGRHAGPYGQEFDQRNVVYLLETSDLTLCHPGDNVAALPESLFRAHPSIDILLVPVDDHCHLMSFRDIARLIDAIDPRIVIPVHYYIAGITHPDAPLAGIDRWLVEQPRRVRHLASPVACTAAELPDLPEVWVMQP